LLLLFINAINEYKKGTGKMGSAIIYIRVSTHKQAVSENGLEAQLEECTQYCIQNGLEVSGVFRDAGVSGSADIADRAGLVEAIEALEKGAVLVVSKRDRIARDVLISAVIEKMVSDKKATLVSADGNGNGNDPASVLMRNILNAMAMYERSLASIRTKAAMRNMKAHGKVYGKIPFGFRRDGDFFVEDERELQILKTCAELRAEKVRWDVIVADLNASERFNRAGNPWTRQNLSSIFKRSALAC
jgi:DNA invertase Pin-like site-specific DNA recombinase